MKLGGSALGSPLTEAASNLHGQGRTVSERNLLRLAGALLFGGFLLTLVVTHAHPSGDDDNHRVIFAKYADSGSWVAVHLGQFAGVLLALGGLLVLYRLFEQRGEVPMLARSRLEAPLPRPRFGLSCRRSMGSL